MKPSRAFWGTFLIALGALFFIGRNFNVDLGWDVVWRLWPLAFVLIGLAVMLKNPRMKWILAVGAAMVIATFVYGVVSFAWLDSVRWNWDDEEVDGTHVQEFTEPLSPSVAKARLFLDAAAGRYSIDSTTEHLFTARTRSFPARYSFDRSATENEVDLRLKLYGRTKLKNWHWGRVRNQAEIKINPTPVWDFDFDVGAASVDFDLALYKVESLRLDVGAATVHLRLGGANPETRVRINAGASSLNIDVPDSVGCEVTLDSGLSSKRLDGFDKQDDGRYRTENFGQAARNIFIDIDSGVSTIRITRY